MRNDGLGRPLVPGVNVDEIDIAAGLRMAHSLGYDTAKEDMVTTYALQRWQRGEESGADTTWLNEHPGDRNAFTAWRVIVAAARAGAAKGKSK